MQEQERLTKICELLHSSDPAERDLGNTLRKQWRAERKHLDLTVGKTYDLEKVCWSRKPIVLSYKQCKLLEQYQENTRWSISPTGSDMLIVGADILTATRSTVYITASTPGRLQHQKQ